MKIEKNEGDEERRREEEKKGKRRKLGMARRKAGYLNTGTQWEQSPTDPSLSGGGQLRSIAMLGGDDLAVPLGIHVALLIVALKFFPRY